MSLYLVKDGKKEKINISATDVQLLDIDNKYKSNNLEDAMKEIGSDTVENMNKIEAMVNKNTGDIAQLSNPNLLLNGDFQVWQRGTSFAGGENGGRGQYLADRWIVTNGIGDWKATKSNDAIKISPDTTKDWHCNIAQIIEDKNTICLRGQTVTFSAHISYADSKNLQLLIMDDNTIYGTKDITETVNSLTVTLPNVEFKKLRFEINFKALSKDKVNELYIAKCKLEIGEKATPFISRSYGEELALCQRYYQSLNLYKQNYYGVGILNATGGTKGILRIPLCVPLRQYPTLILKGKLSVILSDGVTVDSLTADLMGTTICKVGVNLSKELPMGVYPVEGKDTENDLCLDSEIY